MTTVDDISFKLNQLIILRLKTLIINNLDQEDIQEFEQVVSKYDFDQILEFARKKIPYFIDLHIEEMLRFGKKISELYV